MLIDEIIDFCDDHYKSQNTKCVWHNCNHQDKCSGSSKQCLKEIHFPDKYPIAKKEYDCCNLINIYVCDYTHKYAYEMLYLLRESGTLKEMYSYHIMSIGCGAAPNLIAFEQHIRESQSLKTIYYWCIDKKELWQPVHDVIEKYMSKIVRKSKFKNADAIELCNQKHQP